MTESRCKGISSVKTSTGGSKMKTFSSSVFVIESCFPRGRRLLYKYKTSCQSTRFLIVRRLLSSQDVVKHVNIIKMTDPEPTAVEPTTEETPAPKPKAKKKKSKKPANHPKYCDMIKECLTQLKERNGSSRQAIVKYIMTNYNVGEDLKVVNNCAKMALKAGAKNGTLKRTKGTGASGSFKLGEKAEPKKKPTKPAAKKATVKSAKKTVTVKVKTPKKPKARATVKSPKKASKAKPAKAKAAKPKKATKSPKKKPAKAKAKSPKKAASKK